MISTLTLSLLLAGGIGPAAPKKGEFALRSNDVVVFCGGTISLERTKKGFRPKYPSFVESFVRARYPSIAVQFHNRAKDADRAAAAARRIEKDVLSLKPTAVILCFGMSEARQASKDAQATDDFAADVTAMIKRLKKTKCRVWLLTPPCADEERFAALRRLEVNERLQAYVEALKTIAAKQKVGLIDWYSASAQTLTEQRKRNSRFRLSSDGADPTNAGHSVAAVEILRAWSAEPYDHKIIVDFADRTVQCSVGKATVKKDSPAGELEISFEGLPMFWPLSAGRASQADFTWPVQDMNRLLLEVTHAPETGMLMRQGRREVPVLPFQLAEGVNLAVTPGFRDVGPCTELFSYVLSKNNVLAQRWLEGTARRPSEPELQEPFDRFLEVLALYAVGYQKIIDRIPRRFDATLVLKDIMAEAAVSSPSTSQPASKPDDRKRNRKR